MNGISFLFYKKKNHDELWNGINLCQRVKGFLEMFSFNFQAFSYPGVVICQIHHQCWHHYDRDAMMWTKLNSSSEHQSVDFRDSELISACEDIYR